MSMCRCAPSSRARAQQPAQPVGGVALAALGRVGPQQRRERGDLDGQVRARERAGGVALERRPLGPVARRAGERLERLVAALGVALRLGLGDGRLAEQVDGARDAVLPQLAQRPERGLRALADDEAVRHVLDAGRRGRAERGRGPARVLPIRIATATGGGGVSTSPRKPVRWRARSSSERHAGTTSTKRNSAAFSSASCEASSIALLVGGLERVARGRRAARRAACVADLEQLGLEPRLVGRLPARRREAALGHVP